MRGAAESAVPRHGSILLCKPFASLTPPTQGGTFGFECAAPISQTTQAVDATRGHSRRSAG